MRFAAGTTPVNGGNISSISGNVTFDVSALPDAQNRSRLPLLAIDKSRIASGTDFQAVGARRGARVEYDDDNGVLLLVQTIGLVITVQ